MAKAGSRWDLVVQSFAGDAEVSLGEGRGFGAGTLKAKGKIFAFVSSKGEFVVKLPKARAAALFASGQAVPFDPGHGRAMKQWAAFSDEKADWLALAKEARKFVGGG